MNTKTEIVGGLLLILLIAGFATIFSSKIIQTSPVNQPTVTPTGTNQTHSTNNQLQLSTFTIAPRQPVVTVPFISKTPFPTQQPGQNICDQDALKVGNCTCAANETNGVVCDTVFSAPCEYGGASCSSFALAVQKDFGCASPKSCIYVQDYPDQPGVPHSGGPNQNYQKYLDQCGNKQVCFGKPVIYLYPDKAEYVDVQLDIPGVVTQSIPPYPLNGWQHIFALPDGTFFYNNTSYHELYYESSVNKNEIPTEGWVIAKDEVKNKLITLSHNLGLHVTEQQELLDYWLPKLHMIDKPYLFIGMLTSEQKKEVDHVIISPNPDTNIAFLLYFKGLNQYETIKTPDLPAIPKRKGFTAVEWGGTIAYEQ